MTRNVRTLYANMTRQKQNKKKCSRINIKTWSIILKLKFTCKTVIPHYFCVNKKYDLFLNCPYNVI